MPVRHPLAELGGRRAEADLDARMVEQRLEERGVPGGRELLERVGEVPVVRARPDRDPRADRGVELGRVDAPLLARVAPEEELVQLATDARDDGVLGGAHVHDRCREPGEERGHVGVGLEPGAVEPVQRVAVDRQRQEAAGDGREHAVLVRPPRGEL
jgi:hypothetical protein